MGTRYNAIAGQSIERLAALSDGLFAVSLMPFSTSLMAEFITLRTALLLYWSSPTFPTSSIDRWLGGSILLRDFTLSVRHFV